MAIFKDPCVGTEDLTESGLGKVYSGSEFKGTVIIATRHGAGGAGGSWSHDIRCEKAAMDAGAQLTLPFTQTGLQHLELSHPHSGISINECEQGVNAIAPRPRGVEE